MACKKNGWAGQEPAWISDNLLNFSAPSCIYPVIWRDTSSANIMIEVMHGVHTHGATASGARVGFPNTSNAQSSMHASGDCRSKACPTSIQGKKIGTAGLKLQIHSSPHHRWWTRVYDRASEARPASPLVPFHMLIGSASTSENQAQMSARSAQHR